MIPVRLHIAAVLTVGAAFSACRTPSTVAGSETLAVGPAQTRPGWLKSPEAIEGTIVQAWGISMTDADRWKYLQSIYSMLGGTLVMSTKSLVDQPNELLMIGLDNLSGWLSAELVRREFNQENADEPYMFEGLGLSGPDTAGCFANDAEDWCDFQDGIKITSLTNEFGEGGDVMSLNKTWKKRLMHNIQDIGEFMLLAIDNTLKVPGSERPHAAAYLLEEVFLPHLKNGVTEKAEQEAWNHVTYTILMSGGFYLEAPAENTASSH